MDGMCINFLHGWVIFVVVGAKKAFFMATPLKVNGI
jgi:hypothetical protein